MSESFLGLPWVMETANQWGLEQSSWAGCLISETLVAGSETENILLLFLQRSQMWKDLLCWRAALVTPRRE